jgi:uncharacterized lipoprotein YddW (UPF0748 family)
VNKISHLFGILSIAILLINSGEMHATTIEVRGTWLTTTGNAAIASPADTAISMRKLKEIGINTVYVESWKNGYAQFPSEVLQSAIGIQQRPPNIAQDPGDKHDFEPQQPRDLLQETLIEAHRNGLIYISWFEYGFMAAHKDTMNHLRHQKPEWLSRDVHGSEIAPNGFVWLNPLHPEARQFLLDLVLEAIDKYDLDGVQLDDRIVWPHITMGYDATTQKIYAQEHDGRLPPNEHTNAEWMRWRADKVNEYAKIFVQEVRAKRPGLLISLSPAVYPWSWEHYLLEWPKWSAWTKTDIVKNTGLTKNGLAKSAPRWDEFIPQTYRFSYDDFAKSWMQQVNAMRELGGDRQRALVAGIRIVGDGKDSSWDQLKRSIELTRQLNTGGHVLWYSRGVLDIYPAELKAFYANSGAASSPHFPVGWRSPSIPMQKNDKVLSDDNAMTIWKVGGLTAGQYRIIAADAEGWHYLDEFALPPVAVNSQHINISLPRRYLRVELLIDRRMEMMQARH